MPIEDLLIKKELHAEIEYARMNPAIIHFISTPKPWHIEYNMPLTRIWRFFKNMTPWKSEKLKYYSHGSGLLKYKIKRLLEVFNLRKPDLWKADQRLDMEMITKRIYSQINKNNDKNNTP
jgi:lipopolysaccharide biosynthesis glycosyltransferase